MAASLAPSPKALGEFRGFLLLHRQLESAAPMESFNSFLMEDQIWPSTTRGPPAGAAIPGGGAAAASPGGDGGGVEVQGVRREAEEEEIGVAAAAAAAVPPPVPAHGVRAEPPRLPGGHRVSARDNVGRRRNGRKRA
ncbi:hypothetical protein ACJRO7_020569 [Eucalyptus globulus]|uniref:Uncharacterized protein n=1 Tax=Eucalyptus globulus TaxID=34317 RepID=A0ABD3KIJ6_EUCGL